MGMRPELVTATLLVKGGMTFGEAARQLKLTRNQVAGACFRRKVRGPASVGLRRWNTGTPPPRAKSA